MFEVLKDTTISAAQEYYHPSLNWLSAFYPAAHTRRALDTLIALTSHVIW